MWYEINIGLNGKHFFATSDRNITDRYKLKAIVKVFLEKFPKSEGYDIMVTYNQTIGEHVSIHKIID